MSKEYTYESIKNTLNLDVNNKAQIQAAKINPRSITERLRDKNHQEQLDILYSAIRDLGTNKTNPIITTLTKHMEENGISKNSIDAATTEGIAQREILEQYDPLSQRKIKPAQTANQAIDEEFGPFQSAPPLMEKPITEPGTSPQILSAEEENEKLKARLEALMPQYIAQSEATKKRNIIDEEFGPFQSAPPLMEKPIIETVKSQQQLSAKDEIEKLKAGLDALMPQYIAQAKAMKERNINSEISSPSELTTEERSRTLSSAKANTDNLTTSKEEIQEPEAQDSIIFGPKVSKNSKTIEASSSEIIAKPQATSRASTLDEIDPITESIRKEILQKQQKLLQAEMSIDNPPVKTLTPKGFRQYLTSDIGREEVAKIFTKPGIQAALNKIEVEGYKEVHTKFKENFKDVAWASEQTTMADQPKTKSCEIKNDDGHSVANIKETTHDRSPLTVALENGDSVNIKSYRTIDFPTKLEQENGPLHLSMAVKDQNGKNISEKDAIYFTAHYDDKGKLTEISSPIPVKFMGKGDDAVGYIERNGKVYTLPVTQGKYKEMMKEVQKNKGMGVDLSQEVAKEAPDLAMTKNKNPEQATEKEKPVDKEISGDSIILEQEKSAPAKIQKESEPAIPLIFASTDEKTVKATLQNTNPDQVIATLKDQIAKGNNGVVEMIVEATKPTRINGNTQIPQLEPKQFADIYHEAMKNAPKAPNQASLNKTHTVCSKLLEAAKLKPDTHRALVTKNTQALQTKGIRL